MMRVRVFAVCATIACGGAATPAETGAVTLPTPSASSATPSATNPTSSDPTELVHAALRHWLAMLERDDDENVIREMVLPAELERALSTDSKTLKEIADEFHKTKHDEVVKTFRAAIAQSPKSVAHDDTCGCTLVTFENASRELAFYVDGTRVHLKGH